MQQSVSSRVPPTALDEFNRAETHLQSLESASFFYDTIFVTALFFLTWTRLSNPMYKICTLVSTGFVENPRAAARPPPRKPLPDADFRGAGVTSL